MINQNEVVIWLTVCICTNSTTIPCYPSHSSISSSVSLPLYCTFKEIYSSSPIYTSLECGKKLEPLEETHVITRRICNFHTGVQNRKQSDSLLFTVTSRQGIGIRSKIQTAGERNSGGRTTSVEGKEMSMSWCYETMTIPFYNPGCEASGLLAMAQMTFCKQEKKMLE